MNRKYLINGLENCNVNLAQLRVMVRRYENGTLSEERLTALTSLTIQEANFVLDTDEE
jgi:hypothetical protein